MELKPFINTFSDKKDMIIVDADYKSGWKMGYVKMFGNASCK